ncbi:HAD family hydrolase, partial [Patescibacteria group bacterium]|nr:HAD family hydrolase [Patescibacteria group bacterium]
MKKYKYILLDWDGCLAKTLDNWLSAYKKVFAKEGLHPTTEEVVSKAFSEREQGMVNIGSKDPNVSWSMVVDEVNKNISNVKLYKGAKTVLDALKKQKKKMALHTSSDRKTVIPQLKNHHLLKYFDTILTRDDVVNRKPNPEVLQKALKEIGGTTHQAIT